MTAVPNDYALIIESQQTQLDDLTATVENLTAALENVTARLEQLERQPSR